MKNICKRQVTQTAHHAADKTNKTLCGAISSHWHLSIHKSPCSELFWILWVQSALESAYSQAKIILTGALETVWAVFCLKYSGIWITLKQKYISHLICWKGVWALACCVRMAYWKIYWGFSLLNNWNLFSVQCCFLVLCGVATVKCLVPNN